MMPSTPTSLRTPPIGSKDTNQSKRFQIGVEKVPGWGCHRSHGRFGVLRKDRPGNVGRKLHLLPVSRPLPHAGVPAWFEACQTKIDVRLAKQTKVGHFSVKRAASC